MAEETLTVNARLQNISNQVLTLRPQLRPGVYLEESSYVVIPVGDTVEVSPQIYPLVASQVTQLVGLGFVDLLALPQSGAVVVSYADLPTSLNYQTQSEDSFVEVKANWITLTPRTADPSPFQAPDGTIWTVQGPTLADPYDVRVRLNGQTYSLFASLNGETILELLLQNMYIAPQTPLLGTADGANLTFNMSFPVEPNTVSVYIGGVLKPLGSYTVEETSVGQGYDQIVFVDPPPIGALVTASYFRRIQDFFP